MDKTKIDARALLKRVKSKGKPERSNYTFRFRKDTMDAFKKVCERQEVTATEVLEELMADFMAGLKS